MDSGGALVSTASLPFWPGDYDVPAGLSASAVFAGAEYDPARDAARLTNQVECIRAVAIDGQWRTVEKLTAACRRRFPLVGFPENSVSAQLRNLRKLGYRVDRRHVEGTRGLHEYRLLELRDQDEVGRG